MAGMGETPQFNIDAKVGEINGLTGKIEAIRQSMGTIEQNVPTPYLRDTFIEPYFRNIYQELGEEEGKIQTIQGQIQQYRENLQRIIVLEGQKRDIEARMAEIRQQITDETAREYTPPRAGGSKKRRKIDTKSIKMKKSSMKRKSSKTKDIRKIKKYKEKK